MSEFKGIDSKLVVRAKKGDRVALMRLLFHVKPTIMVQLVNRIPRELASLISPEDILQETWLRAHQQIGNLEADCPEAFNLWIQRIAERRLQTEVRALKTKKRGGNHKKVGDIANDIVVNGAQDHAPTPRRAMELDEVIVAVQMNLEGLPTTQREAVNLHHIESLTLEETAKRLGKSPGMIRGLLDRAKRAMRLSMGESSKWFSKK